MNMSALGRVLRPLRQKILLMLARGMVRAVEDSEQGKTITAELLGGEESQGLKVMQQYGFASEPLENTEVMVLFPAGDRSLGLAVATEKRELRPKDLDQGEVALYGKGDAVGEDEPPLELPAELPPGWPVDTGGPRQRLTFKNDGREVELVCDKFTVRAMQGIDLLSLGQIQVLGAGVSMGNFMVPVNIDGESFERLARVGDCVHVEEGSSAGHWKIVESCDG
jgi:hypothetical protein